MQALCDRLQIVLGHREQHADRLKLRNHDNAVGVARRDIITQVDLAQSDATVDRREDPAIIQIHLGRLDRGAVGFDRALVLGDKRDLRIQRLVRHRILCRQPLIAREIDLRSFENRFVARKLTLGLGQRRFIRARIDLGNEVAFFDFLAFLEIDLDQIAADLAPDGDGGQRRDGSQRVEIDANIALADRFRDDRHRRGAPAGATACALLRSTTLPGPPHDAGDHQQNHQSGQNETSARPRLVLWRSLIGRRFGRGLYGLVHEPAFRAAREALLQRSISLPVLQPLGHSLARHFERFPTVLSH